MFVAVLGSCCCFDVVVVVCLVRIGLGRDKIRADRIRVRAS